MQLVLSGDSVNGVTFSIVLSYSTDCSKRFTTPVTLTHSQTHSCTDSRGVGLRFVHLLPEDPLHPPEPQPHNSKMINGTSKKNEIFYYTYYSNFFWGGSSL